MKYKAGDTVKIIKTSMSDSYQHLVGKVFDIQSVHEDKKRYMINDLFFEEGEVISEHDLIQEKSKSEYLSKLQDEESYFFDEITNSNSSIEDIKKYWFEVIKEKRLDAVEKCIEK